MRGSSAAFKVYYIYRHVPNVGNVEYLSKRTDDWVPEFNCASMNSDRDTVLTVARTYKQMDTEGRNYVVGEAIVDIDPFAPGEVV